LFWFDGAKLILEFGKLDIFENKIEWGRGKKKQSC
jgi:hypothetical protein